MWRNFGMVALTAFAAVTALGIRFAWADDPACGTGASITIGTNGVSTLTCPGTCLPDPGGTCMADNFNTIKDAAGNVIERIWVCKCFKGFDQQTGLPIWADPAGYSTTYKCTLVRDVILVGETWRTKGYCSTINCANTCSKSGNFVEDPDGYMTSGSMMCNCPP